MSEASWTFFAVQAPTAFGFMWYWRSESAGSTSTSAPFAFYFDCVADARTSGYTGALPPGPKVPLQEALPEVPNGSIETKHGAVPKGERDEPAAAPVMTIVALPAARAQRRPRGRSPVE
jgi:hypothetical protein